MTKRILALLLCAATLLSTLAFAGCSNQEKEEDKGQYITAYLTDNVYNLDPAYAYRNEALSKVVGLMFDTLFKLDKNGNVQKSLVKKYVIEENEAAGEYKMQLYLNDTFWSDGTAVSANDIRFAWLRLLEVDANFEAASLLFDIKNARAAKEGDVSIDDVQIYAAEQQMLEIYFEGKIDYDHFIFNLTSLALAPLREDVVSKGDDWAKKPGTMVCSGPFKLGRINVNTLEGERYYDENHQYKDPNGFEQVGRNETQQVITDFILERNAYYYRDYEEDKLKKSVTPYRICVDCSLTDEQLADMYEAGMILYIGDIPLSLRKDSEIAKDAKVAKTSMSTNSVYLNQNAIIDNGGEGEKLFANPVVRQALSMVIDREAIAREVVYAEAATGLVPTGVFATGDDQILGLFHKSFRDQAGNTYAALQTNEDAAVKLLEDEGIKPRKYSFELTCAAYDEVHCLIADRIAEAWSRLGFNVTVKKIGTIQNNDYYKHTDSIPPDICDDLYADELRLGTFDAIVLDYVAYSADPFSVLSSFAKPFSGRGMDMSNPDEYKLTPHITGYDSPEYNQLIEDIFAEKNIKNRADGLVEAEEMLMEDLPIIPVVFNLDATVTSSKLIGEKSNYYGLLSFQKCQIFSYNKYLEAGNKYISDHFGELKFYESNDCSFKPVDDTPENILAALDLFKTSNTIYTQFFLED